MNSQNRRNQEETVLETGNWKLGTGARPKACRAENTDPRSGWPGLETQLGLSSGADKGVDPCKVHEIATKRHKEAQNEKPNEMLGLRFGASVSRPATGPYEYCRFQFPVSSFQFRFGAPSPFEAVGV
ncbi:MAG: hypothetical protein DRJ65_16570 [Acidobacteria bacterium]|nr:MAG: hypothetical protein DRJ65_16570 [Acidobacteriota bacterium]